MPVVFCLCLMWVTVEAHQTFLRPLDYNAKPGQATEILVVNGVFDQSVHAIPVDQVRKVMELGKEGLRPLGIEAWGHGPKGSKLWRGWQALKYHIGGRDFRRQSHIEWEPSSVGGFCVGVELYTLHTAMEPANFANYLEEIGHGEDPGFKVDYSDPNRIFKERYTKTAKAILRVGDKVQPTVLGPVGLVAEIVPLNDPLQLNAGDAIEVQLLLHGQPLPNQLLMAGQPQGMGGRGRGNRTPFRSDANGRVKIPLKEDGEWWLEFNHMQPAFAGDKVDFITYWTTLTFKIE